MKRRLNIKSTATEFLLVITPVMLCITFLVTGVGRYREYKKDIHDLDQKLDILVDYQRDLISTPLWAVDEKRIQKYLDGLHNDPDFAGSVVFDDTNSEFGSSGLLKGFTLDEVNAFLKSNENFDHEHSFYNHIFKHIWNTKDENSPDQGLLIKKSDIHFTTDTETVKIGTMFLVLSERYQSKQFLNKLSQDLLNIVIISVVLLFTTMTVYLKTTYNPLKKLRHTIKDIRNGKEDSLVGWQGRNEIGQVINEFNEMQTYQVDLKRKLQTSHDKLEIHIQELKKRTQEKILLEYRLRQAQKMEAIGTLAGGIAHDFNNILFPIIGHAEMLIEDLPKDNSYRESVEEIYTSALRAKELVKQILTFSRQNRTEVKFMKIQPVIKEVVKLIRSTIPSTIEIEQDIQKDCGVIKADPTQLHQIVMNLSTNAFHAMEESGGVLSVTLREIEMEPEVSSNLDMNPGVYAQLIVADTGEGMNDLLIQKIFDPFFSTKEIGKGTGMGLSVVHGIVLSLNGTIQVHSEPGQGSEFRVYLPVFKSYSKKGTRKPDKTIQGGTERILLVDDEKSITTMEKNILERLGYQVHSFTDSLSALEYFRSNFDKFDIVITDMAMPNLPGDKLSMKLKKIRPDIPILLCTGFSKDMSQQKAVAIGVSDFLYKPVIKKDLAQKIRQLLDAAATAKK